MPHFVPQVGKTEKNFQFCAPRSRPTRTRPCGNRRCCERCCHSCSHNSTHIPPRNCSRCCTPRQNAQEHGEEKVEPPHTNRPDTCPTRIGIDGDETHSQICLGTRFFLPKKMFWFLVYPFFMFLFLLFSFVCHSRVLSSAHQISSDKCRRFWFCNFANRMTNVPPIIVC